MPRTLDPTTHAVRRDAFLDVAERLMRARGWEQVSIQDVLDELDASKGAFYHYFDSKDALLEAVVARMTDTVMAVIEPIAADARLAPPARLQAVFAAAGQWKTARSDMLLSLVRSWYASENDLARLRVAKAGVARITPVVAAIVREGTAQGAFTPTSPDHAAMILMALFTGSADAFGRLALDRHEGRVTFDEVERFVRAYEEAIERVLGLPCHGFTLIDEASLQVWFA